MSYLPQSSPSLIIDGRQIATNVRNVKQQAQQISKFIKHYEDKSEISTHVLGLVSFPFMKTK